MNDRSPAFDLRAYLAGRWTVERDLLDRASGTRGTFSGVVLFTPTPDGGLDLHEEGTMRWPTFTGPATRDYVLRSGSRPEEMAVFFPDGRPFHHMSFSPEANLDNHWCDPDTYRVAYAFEGPDRFSYSWDVAGPRKDLLLTSHLTRSATA
ncbi:hypothetical protein GA0061083_3849 [Pseudarthrobacter enclensis]|uniref:DUF6314 domain-containing protein n=1 Tax=Pseudarthrobacter enclensis TaxID=993070 RepID=A0A0V8I7G8_9MICC|nr:DUF6314 family protein [Pseudarthrobacter enclensis]KSU70496.1 hypothetical protein AS031_17480 [Pseudarthrobacter enclensis]SCC27883.1 hypothetical protein GA0061083_3849 [Pseudarthrobacter enclensis]